MSNDELNKLGMEQLTEQALACADKVICNDRERNLIEKYCKSVQLNIDNVKENEKIFSYYLKHILRERHINNNIQMEDVKPAIYYLFFKKAKEENVNVTFEVLPHQIYLVRFYLKIGFPRILTALGWCDSKRDGSSIVYLDDIALEHAISKDKGFSNCWLAELLLFLYHEFRHAHQNAMMCNQIDNGFINKETLMWIKEQTIEDNDPSYYIKNYKNMLREIDAEVKGKYQVKDAIEHYFNYLGYKFINKLKEAADDYYADTRNVKHLDPDTGYKCRANANYVIDKYIDKLALSDPCLVYDRLYIQYDENGLKRTTQDLTSEYYQRREAILIEQASCGKDKKKIAKLNELLSSLNELYDYLVNSAKEYESSKYTVKVKHKHRESDKFDYK